MSETSIYICAPRTHSVTAGPLVRSPLTLATRYAVLAVLITNTVFQRIGLNLSSYPLDLGMLALGPLLFFAVQRDEWRIHIGRLLLVAFLIVAIAIGTILNSQSASYTSVLLLSVNYLPYIAVASQSDRERWDEVGRLFLAFAATVAVSGLAQYVLQFVWRPAWLFDFSEELPEVFRNNLYFNTVIEAGSGFKSNGFFLREPSSFSQLMAVSILCELKLRKRLPYLLLFGAGLVVSYSGTGLLMLCAAILLGMDLTTLAVLGSAVLVLLVSQYLFGDPLNLSFTFSRLGEFGSTDSSAYMRFVAPIRMIQDTLFDTPLTAVVGHGAGTTQRLVLGYNFFSPTWAKALYEYGFLGFIAVIALVGHAIFASYAPRIVAIACFAGWLLAGESLLNTQTNEFDFVLFALWSNAGRKR